MIITKLSIMYDVTRLWNECNDITRKYNWGHIGQLSLTHPENITDPIGRISCGTGSLYGTNLKERDFNTFNEEFQGTYLEEVLQSLPYKLGRCRLMRLKGRACYSIHRDTTMRLHLPLVTNPQALMIFPDDGLIAHLPVDGHVYLTDTTVRHSAMNGSLDDRYHLIGALCEV